MKAIPTTYNGVNYRSMLEARYAAWFDLLGEHPLYEPEAWPGYIPDFLWEPKGGIRRLRDRQYFVAGPHSESAYADQILIEVKGTLERFDEEKIRKSGWDGPVVCLDGRGPEQGQVIGGIIYDVTDSSGGSYDTFADFLDTFVDESWPEAWIKAGNIVQWRGRGR